MNCKFAWVWIIYLWINYYGEVLISINKNRANMCKMNIEANSFFKMRTVNSHSVFEIKMKISGTQRDQNSVQGQPTASNVWKLNYIFFELLSIQNWIAHSFGRVFVEFAYVWIHFDPNYACFVDSQLLEQRAVSGGDAGYACINIKNNMKKSHAT